MYRTLIQRYGHFILGAFLLGGGALGVQLRHLQIEPSVNVFLDQGSDDLAFYNLSRTEWAYDEYAMVCVRREDWFTPGSIDVLKKLTATGPGYGSMNGLSRATSPEFGLSGQGESLSMRAYYR